MNSFSKTTLILCYIFMFYTGAIYYPRWNKPAGLATIAWDASGYYMYLPAIFIYQDLKHCQFKDEILKKYEPTPVGDFQQAFVHQKSGNYVMKYPLGHAITMSPFFFIGHLVAKITAYPADGFSYPYQVCVGMGLLLMGFIGLYFLRKILLEYFNDRTVGILLLVYVLGTNYLNFATIDQSITHSALFTYYTLLIYLSILFYKNPRYLTALSIGLLTGLMTLTRPTEILSALIPLFWGVSSFADLGLRWAFFRKHISNYLIAILGFLFLVSWQLIYWKYASGEWIVYSYQEQGFYWSKPHVWDYTFSYKSGWLLYCPMMILPFIGLLPFCFQKKNVWAVLSFFALNFYVVTAWDAWDYGGSSGRAMVQSYPILAFPIAVLIEQMNKYKWTMLLFYPFIFLFTYLNIWWTHQAHKGGIQVSDSTEAFYWRTVGRWTIDDFDRKLLDNPHSFAGYPTDSIVIYTNDFEKDSSINSFLENGNRKIKVDKDKIFSTEYFIDRTKEMNKKWVRASADISCGDKEWNKWKQTLFYIKFHNDAQMIQENMIRVQRIIDYNQTKNISVDAKIPSGKWTKMSVFFWNFNGDKPLTIDNLKVIVFDK